MGKAYLDDTYKEIVYKHPAWEKVATDYEAGFAAKLSNDPIVKESARGVLTKLSKMLNSYYSVQKFKSEHPEECKNGDFSALYDLARESLGEGGVKVGTVLENALLTERENRGSAGQIGNKVLELSAEDKEDEEKVAAAHQENQAMLDAVINGDGNLREQMTLLYNGFFQNGGRTKKEIAASRSFKNMMGNITREDAELMGIAGALANDADALNPGFAFEIIGKQNMRKMGKDIMDTAGVAFDTARAKDKSRGRGSKIGRVISGLIRIRKSTNSGRKFVNQEGFGEEYYNRLGLELSDREREYGTEGGSKRLQWQEGGRMFKMPEPVTAEGMLQVAGSSGTTLRMLAAYRMMGANKKDLLYFRLALIGWMCSSRDHSLYEILQGSRNSGVTGYEDLSDAVAMYASVDPLSPQEIREKYAPNKEYPHETIFKMIVQEAGQAREAKAEARNQKEAARTPEYDYKGNKRRIQDAQKLMNDMVAKYDEKYEEFEEQKNRVGQLEEIIEDKKRYPEAYDESLEEMLELYEQEKADYDELYNCLDALHETYEAAEAEMKAMQEEAGEKGINISADNSDYNLFEESLFTDGSPENADQSVSEKMRTGHINAQDLALNIYTTSAYKIMNESQKYGETVVRAKRKGWKLVNTWAWTRKLFGFSLGDTFKDAEEYELRDGKVYDKVYEALRLANRIAQDALVENAEKGAEEEETAEQNAPKQNAGELLTRVRGGKTPGALYGTAGTLYKTGSLTSTSKDMEVAEQFYNRAAGTEDFQAYEEKIYDRLSIMEFRMNERSGRDISALSVYGEKEVLLPPGVTFRIAKPLREMIYDKSTKELKETDGVPADEIADIKAGGKEQYRIRKVVTLDLAANKQTKFTDEKYLARRKKRLRKREELKKRAEAFEEMRSRQGQAQ